MLSTRLFAFALVLALLPFVAVRTAAADELAYGPRVGYTHDTHLDQLHLGGHAIARNVEPNLHIAPSLELGFGDGTLLAINGDVFYEFTELASGGWSFYAGGGPMLSRYKKDRYKSTDFALNLACGVTREWRHGRTWFGELRIGLEDAPALKLTAGLTFF